MALLIYPDGKLVKVDPENGKTFELDELYNLLDCEMIQIIEPPSKKGAILVIDEEGKLKGKPLNGLATEMWQQHCEEGSGRSFDTVVGTVLLTESNFIE